LVSKPRNIVVESSERGAGKMNSPYFVAIGASGQLGLAQIKSLLSLLPPRIEAIVLVTLHRPSDRISRLNQVLLRVSSIPVSIAEAGARFQIGTCYIGEPADHLALAQANHVRLVPGADDEYRNRTVDLLFTSVALHAKERGIGVVLAGSLDDGSRGLAAIHHAGGVTMVVKIDDVLSEGMPESAAAYDGPIDFLGTIEDIATEIARRTQSSTPVPPADG
jgi:two-component system, chemotaxis family, protein-glutamate methylesterase/glutaminase